MASIFLGSVSILFLETMCPRYLTCNLKNSHLLGLSLKPAAVSFSNTPLNLSICSSGVLENTIMSSRYIIHHFRCISPKQVSIKHWNVASALVKPKGIQNTFIKSQGSNSKGSQRFTILCHFYLPIP